VEEAGRAEDKQDTEGGRERRTQCKSGEKKRSVECDTGKVHTDRHGHTGTHTSAHTDTHRHTDAQKTAQTHSKGHAQEQNKTKNGCTVNGDGHVVVLRHSFPLLSPRPLFNLPQGEAGRHQKNRRTKNKN